MLSDRAARVSDNSFLYALTYFERDGDGLEGEAVRVVGAGPRRRHCLVDGLLLRVDGVLLGPRRGILLFESPGSGGRLPWPCEALRASAVEHCVNVKCLRVPKPSGRR